MAKHSTVAEFEQAVAEQVVKIAQEREASRSTAQDYLGSFDIQGKVTPKGDTLTVTRSVPEGHDPAIPHGIKREQLTPEAAAEYDARYFDLRREQVWQTFRNLSRYGSYSDDQAVGALKALGYTALPEQKTVVTVSIPCNPDENYGDRYTRRSFKLAGDVSQEELNEKLAHLVQDDASNATLRGIFPEAEGLEAAGIDQLAIRRTVESQWPARSEFHRNGR